MFTVILLGYMERDFISTRQLQHFCCHDCRCCSHFHGVVHSHTTFANFINNHLKDSIEEIFQILNLFIEVKADPDLSAHLLTDQSLKPTPTNSRLFGENLQKKI